MIEEIRIERRGGDVSVVVGDVTIPPEAIRRDSMSVPVDPDDVPVVYLTLIAGRVVVEQDVEKGGSE